MAVLGLRCGVRAFSSDGSQASRCGGFSVAEHRFQGFSGCVTQASLLREMRDLPRPGIEPVSAPPYTSCSSVTLYHIYLLLFLFFQSVS